MNSNLAEVGKPTRWPPGQSGNPAGKPDVTERLRHASMAEGGLEVDKLVSDLIQALWKSIVG
jgi:hypothetical protein